MNRKAGKDIVLYYLNKLLKRPKYGNSENHICDWFEENARELIGKDVEEVWEGRGRSRWKRNDEEEKRPLPRDCRTIQKLLEGRTGRLIAMPETQAVLDAFHLSPEYHDVIAMHIHIAHIPLLGSLTESHRVSSQQIMADMLGCTLQRFGRYFAQSGELVGKGLFESKRWDNGYTASETFNEILVAHCRTPEAVKRAVLGKPQKPSLKPELFAHLEEEYVWIRNLLSNALAKRQRGVNILVYGKPGAGKTEIAKTLCKEIDVPLYAVSAGLSDERTGVGRRSDLAAALTLLQGDTRSVLLMDEAEDVFGVHDIFAALFGFGRHASSGAAGKSKLYFNHLLENNTVPVIWVCNEIHGVDPAHLRRFSYALNMESPDEAVQAKIWDYSAKKNKIRIPKKKIDELARSYDLAPAMIDTSLRTAALMEDHDAIEKTIESLQTAMQGSSAKKEGAGENVFSTALLNCDMDLEKLADRITSLKEKRFSLCLYGIPGSGKSAYAHYLAERLKMKTLHKRASDLLGPYVGMTERHIAEAFMEARRKKMLLVIDEADGFLRDRRRAFHSWEVTQVNEMLTRMESHPLPFVCTTNLMDDLDQASLRRFTFKVKYDYLTRKQLGLAFKHFFDAESRVSLAGLNCLTPGDFALVARKAAICGIDEHKELVAQLRQEQEVKEVKRASLGFATNGD